jgi:hypothetical protein
MAVALETPVVGDEIRMLHGADEAYILRPYGRAHKLVGELRFVPPSDLILMN